MMTVEISVEKNEENERSIPTVWRPTFSKVVEAFSRKDYSLSGGIEGVSLVLNETANQIKEYIQDYGEELIQLPDETWDSSVYIWTGSHWNVLIDLWTAGEGHSDLVLSAQVSEEDNRYIINISMVYVP